MISLIIFVLAVFTTRYQSVESLYCYTCTGWNSACNDPINEAGLQYNKMACSGSCYTYKNPNDGNMIYRGCTSGSVIDSFGSKSGTITNNGISYNLCTTDLCNIDNGLAASTTSTSAIATATSPISNTVTTILSTTTPSTTTTTMTTTTTSILYCYECNSNWAACADPINLASVAGNKVACSGSCFTSYSYGVLYRGCTTSFGKVNGQVKDNNGVTYNLCYTPECNTYGAYGPTTTTTTTTTTMTTTAPTTTTTMTASTASTTAATYCYSCDSATTMTCADPINTIYLTQTNQVVSCPAGSCFVTNKNGVLYRGCTNMYGKIDMALRGGDGFIYKLCSTNICNTYAAV